MQAPMQTAACALPVGGLAESRQRHPVCPLQGRFWRDSFGELSLPQEAASLFDFQVGPLEAWGTGSLSRL